jgi:hypothetical protein
MPPAFALVGWYLLLSPLHLEGPASDPNTRVEVDSKAPLSWWKVMGTFDTAKECHDYPDYFRELLRKQRGNLSDADAEAADAMAKYWFDNAQCVATDDPRVAGMKPPAK